MNTHEVQTAEHIDKQLARENFSRWNETLLTKDANKVAALYTEGSTFLPTLSTDFKIGQDGAEQYFTHFLQKNPVGKIVEDEVTPLGNDAYLHSGMYDFIVGHDAGRETVNARFTYLWRKDNNGDWKIEHHHSSLLPKV